jgi:putative DNA primase/helicase
MIWTNYFVTSLAATAKEGHLPASDLQAKIEAHDGREAYHCAYDLDEREDFNSYDGIMRPALGRVWFDFDSKEDGGQAALDDLTKFIAELAIPLDSLFVAYSGSKGFHLGVPFSAFGLEPSNDLGKLLNRMATTLKKRLPTIDTTIYNANRKFRALGSKHPKTGLYKIRLTKLMPLEDIKLAAKSRGTLVIPPAPELPLCDALRTLFAAPSQSFSTDSITLDEWRRYRQPEGTEAFTQCGFLSWARDNPSKVNEPQWYACASVVGRFKDGRAKFHAMSKKHPDYTAAKTDEKLEQALQASGPRTCEAIDTLWDGCKACPLYQKIKSPVVILEKNVIPTEATGFYDLIPQPMGMPAKRVPNYRDLVTAFERQNPFKTISDMKAVYAFRDTHYVECPPIEIKAFAEQSFKPEPSEKLRQEFTHKVFANNVRKKSFFAVGTENRINFQNGILELETGVLAPHSPDYGFRHVLPYAFDPRAASPTFDWWINDVMLGDADLVRILQEFMGYVIRGGEYKYHKALWLSGTGRNGKSTFLSVLKALIGAGNYSTLSIKQIIGDKFSSADLDGKMANFSEETSPEELSDSGPFKNLTGGGELLAQKKYGDPYSFRNRAKLIMTYNEVPMLRDLSPGMISRPIIIPWKKDLTAEGVQDRNLEKKLLAELPGIFNFAIAGWRRLEEQEEFTQSAKSQIEMDEIRTSSCTAAQWLMENIRFEKLETAEFLKPRQLYEAYKAAIGNYAYAEQKFYKRINSIPKVAERRRRTDKGTEYFGMKFMRHSAISADF